MSRRGLTVGPDQTLRLDGARFRNIGLNYGGAITPISTQPSATACAYTTSADQDAMLDVCEQVKAKVLRVKASPYWPAQWLYGVNGGKSVAAATAADREAHYAKIDAFLAKCEARGIGVILCFAFRLASPSDLCGETMRAGWLTPGSATRNFFQTFTQEIVSRYLNHSAVYGWELSNEVNHYNDATDAAMGNYPGVNAAFGSRASYSAANDMFRGLEWSSVVSWWNGIVTAIDNQRIVLTGNGPNSYSQPGGTRVVVFPMYLWHKEQVRDNPTNCGSIHWYGGVGYGSPGFRGLDAILTGVRHWQKQAGRGFLIGEFGNQTVTITSLTGDGTTLTINCTSLPADLGDELLISGSGSPFDGQNVRIATLNVDRTVVTAACSVAGSWSGNVRALRALSPVRLTRMCDDIITSGVDVAMVWMLDNDANRNKLESISDAANSDQLAPIRAANERLGW